MKRVVIGMLLALWVALPAAAQDDALYPPITPENAEDVVELALLSQSVPGAFAWEGDRLAVPGVDGRWLYDVQNLGSAPRWQSGIAASVIALDSALEQARDLPADSGAVSAALTPDGSLLAVGYQDGTIRLWNPATGESLRALDGQTDRVEQVAFDPAGSILASRDAANTIRLWGIPPLATVAHRELEVGGTATAHVTANDVLNVRGGAGTGFAVLDELEDGTPVTILGGPVDADGFRWWQVRTPGGIDGWSVESADGVQTLVP